MRHSRLVHVVDDHEGVRRSVTFLLRSAGFTVEAWSSGSDFLRRFDPAARACILLDVRMPPPDGIEVQQALNRRGIVLPVIMMTGHLHPEIVLQALRAGALNIIAKPFERAVLLAAAEEAFRYITRVAT